jgi:glutamate dehydrogenase/leucine dehydrogenase
MWLDGQAYMPRSSVIWSIVKSGASPRMESKTAFGAVNCVRSFRLLEAASVLRSHRTAWSGNGEVGKTCCREARQSTFG